ncbi:putative transcription factor bZIP family [Helianthus annuus]|uniref:Transcription factor bZIP family n=1 Tax=Helianthus annuus TaxID=4232 RepID=A0A9K3NG72_HELAN|nr:putative transcription factor bZIP family [Helianthus annuus]KAJ0905175.1 putative transcription factor bZIP family [Helianthus annuus]
MSRQPQLPPRCPISKSNSLDPPSSGTFHDEYSRTRLYKSLSQSFDMEEQPEWLDDLLGDWDPGFKSKSHRRAASDSGTVFDELVDLPNVKTEKDDDTAVPALDSDCKYGPNSPRSKDKVSVQENNPAGEADTDAKPFKRHSAQRSRVRKLQYIAELERTVENYQNIVSELVVRVKSLGEQRVYMSIENKQLKQQLGRLQQEKFVKERQYQLMRNEVEGLKRNLAYSRNGNKGRTHFRSNSSGDVEKLNVEPNWRMIDMGKLHIN